MSTRVLTAFTVIGFILLVWCFFTLWASLSGNIPCTTLFPEVDFASNITLNEKIDGSDLYSTSRTVTSLSSLSNSGSVGIRRRFAFTTFGIKFSEEDRVMEEDKVVFK